jgi:tetratricopeptide (TPR) repeat protein
VSGRRPLLATVALLLALGCSTYQPFDSAGYLREQYAARIGPARAAGVAVPFALDEAVRAEVDRELPAESQEDRRIEVILDYIFHRLDLKYAMAPTRNAVETFQSRRGNCLSFVNLFVGIARQERLAPFYVEVTDLQRWDRKENTVISQGHIVAGLYVNGRLATYDFLPYRPKSYRSFKPIDDLTAAAHYYNNLGAEALLAGDLDRAQSLIETAAGIAPAFDKALNNLGVCYARRGQLERALAVYQQGLAASPDNPLILTNQARAYQEMGRLAEAKGILAKIETSNTTNPYFFLYEGESALAAGDPRKALDYMARALRLDTELPEVHVGLVKVYLALGDVTSARHHLERALALDGTNAEARKLARMLGT